MTKKDLKNKYTKVLNNLIIEIEDDTQEIYKLLDRHNIDYSGNLINTVNKAIRIISDETETKNLLRLYSWIKAQKAEIKIIENILEEL